MVKKNKEEKNKEKKKINKKEKIIKEEDEVEEQVIIVKRKEDNEDNEDNEEIKEKKLSNKEQARKKIVYVYLIVFLAILLGFGIIKIFFKTYEVVFFNRDKLDNRQIIKVKEGKRVKSTDVETPHVDNKTFMGWYYLENGVETLEEFSFDTKINSNLKVYAKYSDITLKLLKEDISIYQGGKYKIEAQVRGDDYNNLVWSSEDITIAEVDKDGIVTGIKEGTTYIVATIKGVKEKCKVTVTKETFSFNLIDKEVDLFINSEYPVKYEILGSTDLKIEWSTDNKKIVSVYDGIIKGISGGTCTVTATIGKYSATMTVNVSPDPEILEISNDKPVLSINTADNTSTYISYHLENNNDKQVNFSVTGSCATINQNTGYLEAKNCPNGETVTVYVKTRTGLTKSLSVYIEPDLVFTYNGTIPQTSVLGNDSNTFTTNQDVTFHVSEDISFQKTGNNTIYFTRPNVSSVTVEAVTKAGQTKEITINF